MHVLYANEDIKECSVMQTKIALLAITKLDIVKIMQCTLTLEVTFSCFRFTWWLPWSPWTIGVLKQTIDYQSSPLVILKFSDEAQYDIKKKYAEYWALHVFVTSSAEHMESRLIYCSILCMFTNFFIL